jgi:SAM-dependent methyltransferase
VLAKTIQHDGVMSDDHIVTALYRGILGRDADPAGLSEKVAMLMSVGLEQVAAALIHSPEFRERFLPFVIPTTPLPDLLASMPDHYEHHGEPGSTTPVYIARSDADVSLMASLIEKHRYYDHFGVWNPSIDRDKEITAAIVRGLQARSCFELGCFTGAVISLLADAGLAVTGMDTSHLAFVFAYPNIRDALLFGDTLTLTLARRFDVILCVDVLEHICPLRLDASIAKLISAMEDDGYIYLNSPMCGEDRIFGMVEQPYLAEWQSVGDTAYWRRWPCDAVGWPLHGHLVWASPAWWERTFRRHGLVRDETIETAIQQSLGAFFESAPGRRSLFVLRRPSNKRNSDAVADAVRQRIFEINH